MITHTIRQACKEDIPQMVGLLEQLFSIEKDFMFDGPRHAHGLQMLLEMENSRLVVAHANKIVGMCSMQILVSTAEGGRSGLIEDVIVDAPYRSQGIGTALLHNQMQWARKHHLKRLTLLADKDNHMALAFYARHHWQASNMICLRYTMDLL